MSTTNNPFLARVTIFDGNNWGSFSKDTQVFFQLEGNWEIVNGTKKKPSDADEAEKWTRQNERAYSMIYFLLGADYRSIIADVSTGVEAWKLLKDEYQKDSSALRLALRNQLYSIRHDPKQPISVYIEAIRTVACQLKAIGHEVKPEDLADIILLRLHPSFSSIRSTLSNVTPFPKLDDLISAIKAYELQETLSSSVEQTIKKEEEEEVMKEKEDHAMLTREGRKGVKGKFDWGNSKDKEGVCHRCGLSGHIARRCVADMPDDVKAKILTSRPDAGIADDDEVIILGVEDDSDNVAYPAIVDPNDDESNNSDDCANFDYRPRLECSTNTKYHEYSCQAICE
ncbi:hypothetical protein MSAN_02121000 [Mycena sanguinolenta]|uniref:CCHC-type domain-containing protein n=1 Tax=Mycena sanguinolenta TaxID=230812 RepID=A0A8H7CLI2_9AGAR|nr:hypothetical protein MSAN_02121000 [Mycena sanguinolenta]